MDPFKKIVESSREAVFILDKDRQILFANQAAEKQFGDELVGQSFVRIIRHPECLSAIEEVLQGADRRACTISLEKSYRIIFEVSVVDLGKFNDDLSRIVVSLLDISHVYQAEQMRSDFVANVSHELRSPLTSLSGFIETLQGSARNDPTAQERFLNLMQQEAQRMVRLLSDLLSLSKVEANQRVRPDGEADIVSVLKRIMKTLSEQAEKERKTFVFKSENDHLSIPGSDDELTQVFQNLIENSIKYAAHNTAIEISVKEHESAIGITGNAVSITVSDHGDGIPRQHLPRLTERFYRVDTHRSRDKGGTGLGLAIVKHIVGRHRGRMQIDSEIGEGSSFKVFLPATKTLR